MKEKFNAYTAAALSFVAFSLVLFVIYLSKNIDGKQPVDASVVDTYFIENHSDQRVDTPPPVRTTLDSISDSSKQRVTEQKKDSSTAKKTPQEEPEKKEVTVYICNSGSAYAYHRDSYCKGLNRCKADINPVTQTQAINWGRRACKICY